MSKEDGSSVDDGRNQEGQRISKSSLYAEIEPHQWPIIYGPEYNIGFMGLEKLHPFDAGKWGKVYQYLKEAGLLQERSIVQPQEASSDDLMVVHPKSYISSLKWSMNVAKITEVPPVAFLPNMIVQSRVLRPFRFHTGGTVLAGKLAMERGWAINIGGGFHHCSADRGGGFCAYADITLSIKFLFEKVEAVSKVLIIDLDAHQGNGHERDFMDDDRVYILDVYNRGIYPHDGFAKRAIKRKIELDYFTEDKEYLRLVERHVEGAMNEFEADVIVYNAGTDILEDDPLGLLSISAQGIIHRDEIVFKKARSKGIPIFMVTSGGYQKRTARIIADSILNLKKLKLIECEEAETSGSSARPAEPSAASTSGVVKSKSGGSVFGKFFGGLFTKTDDSTVGLAESKTTKSEMTVPTEEKRQHKIEEDITRDGSLTKQCDIDNEHPDNLSSGVSAIAGTNNAAQCNSITSEK